MYAVIRAGGKQYRVAPGDVIRVESQGNGKDGKIDFSEVLAVSGGEGQIAKPQSEARVVGSFQAPRPAGRLDPQAPWLVSQGSSPLDLL